MGWPTRVQLQDVYKRQTQVLPMKEWGIKTLDAVSPGLPRWSFPDLTLVSMDEVVTISLSVAVVIMAETLLSLIHI